MPSTADATHCPHCGHLLVRVTMPDNSGWQEPYHLACFNDDCSYYRKGWDWMYEHYRVRASYRYRIDPVSKATSPLPVWSSTAHRDRILEDDAIDSGRDSADRGSAAAAGADDVIPEEAPGTGGEQ